MPFNGSGIFQRGFSWQQDAAAGVPISPVEMDGDAADLAAGLTNAMTRDGQSPPTADIPMGGHKLTGLADPSNPADAVTFKALQAAIAAGYDGRCRVKVVNGGNLIMLPQDGNGLVIGGTVQAIPDSGVPFAAQSSPVFTDLFLYAYMAGTAMALETSTTGYTIGAAGRLVKASDPSRRLVARLSTDGAGAFRDDFSFRGCANYFNRRDLVVRSNGTFNTSATGWFQLTSQASMLSWGDEIVRCDITGSMVLNTAGLIYLGIGIDGGASNATSASVGANAVTPAPLMQTASIAEGVHTYAPFGYVSSGTGSYSIISEARTRG